MRFFATILIFTFGFTGFAMAQDKEEVDFVIKFFDKLQPITFSQNKEYCGYFGFDENDNYVATKPTRGDEDSCLADEPPENIEIFASYHTHGAFSFESDSELPSSNDLEADIEESVDGYTSTPGGRIWFTDSLKEISTMLCGRNCTVSDDRYEEDAFPPVLKKYDMKQLLERDNLIDDY